MVRSVHNPLLVALEFHATARFFFCQKQRTLSSEPVLLLFLTLVALGLKFGSRCFNLNAATGHRPTANRYVNWFSKVVPEIFLIFHLPHLAINNATHTRFCHIYYGLCQSFLWICPLQNTAMSANISPCTQNLRTLTKRFLISNY